MPPWLRLLAFVVAPIVLIVGGTIGTLVAMNAARPKPETTDEAPKGVAVFVVPAARETVTLSVATQGEATPRREIDIVPQVAGRLVAVSDQFIKGGFFEADDLLVQIEDADYRLAVTRAEAQVAQAETALAQVQADAEIARREWDELGEGDPTALTLREPQLAEARANVAAARASLADARLQLSRTRVTAPFNGRVREQHADLGQYVTPGQRLAEVFSTDVMQVSLPLTDGELALLDLPVAFEASEEQPGPQVWLTAVVAGRERVWNGHIARTDSVFDARTRTLAAIAEVIDPYDEGADDGAPLPAGLFVTATIAGSVIEDAFVLPREALRSADTTFVAAQDGTLSIRTVTVASSDRERVVVTDGVEDGEWVVTSPILSAAEGMAIEAFGADGALLFPLPEDAATDADGDTDGDADADADEPDERADAVAAADGEADEKS